MPRDNLIKKILVIGSGPIVIGQAAEFDYAGAQACGVLKAEGINVVLANSNPATIMTDHHLADEIYLEPLTVDTLKRIIEKEHPDSLLAGLGGQTGLTLAMMLSEDGWLDAHGVRLLGSDIEAIQRAEDRDLFRQAMRKIGQPVVASGIATTEEEALSCAKEIGYPVIVRPAFTLGGSGGGIAANEEELRQIAHTGLGLSPITQVLIERSIAGWKEIEFETMRDSLGNVIAVCSMENVDPVGIHTGDSIVVSPCLTLADREFQMLRKASLDIITELNIVGGCNVQLALDPESFEYAVIEVNPRVSRSSALASKATGYPIAKVTTKIALGYTLDEIRNEVTGKTCSCFEPALDYVVVKYPKWPFDKFAGSSRSLGTQMKATGEVMAIASCFEAALLKAIRGAEIGLDTLNYASKDPRSVRERLHDIDDHRLFTVFEALKAGVSIEEIHAITKIDEWFLFCLKNLVRYEERISHSWNEELYLEGKRLGYTDEALKRIAGVSDIEGRPLSYKMVDTCAAEFSAETPYFYSSADDECESRSLKRSEREVIMVLGSGPIRIGQGIEFDYSSVHCVWTLRELGYDVVIVNNNPETVSTDFDTADRLYFEPLCPEDVMHIIRVEQPIGVVVAFGGQTAIKLTSFLDAQGIPILGTSAESIDLAEDRERFDALLEELHVRRPKGAAVVTMEEAVTAAEEIGYPVLLRPSYVIGGQNMTIAHAKEDTVEYMGRILAQGIENPVLIDRYLPGTELEVDVISDGTNVLIPGIMEHIERAGVHSGDSIAVYPPYNLNDKDLSRVIEVSEQLTLAMKTRGLVNIQYLMFGGELYVIEVNPRASRTVPYISKVTGVPMVDLAANVMLGKNLLDLGYGSELYKTPPYSCVKVPVFSFEKLSDANSILGPEMKSTGEVLGIGRTLPEALFKGLTAAGFRVPPLQTSEKGGVLISVETHDYQEILDVSKKLYDLGMKLYATTGTAETIQSMGIEVTSVANATESDEIISLMEEGKLSYIIYTGAVKDATMGDYTALHQKAMLLNIPCLTSVDTANALTDMLASHYNAFNTELVDINHMRAQAETIPFTKMHDCGNDYIFIENFDGKITSPESLCVTLCAPHYGIGADGIVLIEHSEIADAKMRSFNKDGTEGRMAGNNLRCTAKYLYDRGIVVADDLSIETAEGMRSVRVYTNHGKVGTASVNMGRIEYASEAVPVQLEGRNDVVNVSYSHHGRTDAITCLSVGNPHCVMFREELDNVNLEVEGLQMEYDAIFPDRANIEFVRVVDPCTLRVRVWERGNGATLACGTGACASAAAAIRLGYCKESTDITVKLPGGDMVVRIEDGICTLTGGASEVFRGTFVY
ncbi:MAG: carbamoyl-phosphate synthase large subunit [Solobacterium sp.]|nr:carbamoyl-phosphate synthase large subunit [Solobacterium sp.]